MCVPFRTMRLPSSATCIPLLTTRVPLLAPRASSSGFPCPAVQVRSPRRGSDPTQRNPQRGTPPWQRPCAVVSAAWRQPSVGGLRSLATTRRSNVQATRRTVAARQRPGSAAPRLRRHLRSEAAHASSMTDVSDAFPPAYRAQMCYGASVRRTTLA